LCISKYDSIRSQLWKAAQKADCAVLP